MSEHVLAQPQSQNATQETTKVVGSLQHRDMNQPEPTTLQEWLLDTNPGTFAEPRVGYDFSHVPAFTGMVRQNQPQLRTQPMLQRSPKDGAGGSAPCPNCPEAESPPTSATVEPAMETTSPAQPTTEPPNPVPKAVPIPAEPATEPPSPGETPALALIVEDSTADLAPGQMKKSQFLSQLRGEVCRAVEAAIAGTGRTTDECPYIDYWFDFYNRQDSAHIERAIPRYAPEALSVTTANEYISIITHRARQAAETWARTGEITGVPEGIPTNLPGESSTPNGEGGETSTGPVMFKAREGGARTSDDPQVIKRELGEGRPLGSGVRSRMESAFGMDFAHVRAHTDTTAAGLSNRFNARAFTVGEHVAFGAGEYQPGTLVGDAIIAHELAHTIQQSGGTESAAQMKGDDSLYNNLEDDADQSAVGAMVTLWRNAKGTLPGIAQNAIPILKSGFRLQRCDGCGLSCDAERERVTREAPADETPAPGVGSGPETLPGETPVADEAPAPEPPTVDITAADITNDSISVTLGPEGTEGELTLELTGPGAPHTIRTQPRNAGTHTETFDISNLPNGEYDTIRASWQVGETAYEDTAAHHFQVLGNYRHSQYNIPHEDSCGGDPVDAYITDAACTFTRTTLIERFVSQVNLNGSGVSTDHGNVQRENFCLRHENAPDDAENRSFRGGAVFHGSCNGNTGALDNTTVANCPRHPHLGCNDNVYIHTVGIKTVTDFCPGCCDSMTQLDNFTTAPDCAGIRDLGNFTTIKLFPEGG